jgi:hypothetical protein
MASYRTHMLWNNDYQNRTISGWTDMLAEWNDSMFQGAFVETVLENLKATSNWDSGRDFPLSHFVKFLNNEPEAMKWFLYEVVSLRWMWGESRIDYVKELVQIVDLDAYFPEFPGSPQNLTVRQFLENHLNEDELEYIEMPAHQPVTTRIGNITIQIGRDGRRIITTCSNPTSVQTSNITTPQHNNTYQEEPVVSKKEKKVKEPKPASFQIRFNRASGDDDTINIYPNEENTYSIVFRDTSVGITHSYFDMDENDVQRYLSQVLRMSCIDEDPYENIQLNFPGRPQVILPFNPDSYTRELIYECVETVMENWPMNV